MDKIWSNTDGGDRVIAVVNETLYKANPRDDQMSETVRSLQLRQAPADMFALPLPYIKEVWMQQGKDYIQVFFRGNSEEHYRVKNDALREEIFAFLKENIENSRFYLEEYGPYKAARKPLIALAVIAALGLMTLYFTLELQAGTEFEVRGAGLGAITYFLATLGPAKSIPIFGGLAAIALLSIVNKMRNPPVIQRLVFGPGAKTRS
jgi:hypothetical protein